jgi:hypothetical protein
VNRKRKYFADTSKRVTAIREVRVHTHMTKTLLSSKGLKLSYVKISNRMEHVSSNKVAHLHMDVVNYVISDFNQTEMINK